jgi:hypothetical protein
VSKPALPPVLHSYMVQRHTLRIGWPLRFSGGERIVAVLSSEPQNGLDILVTVLVELPDPGQEP